MNAESRPASRLPSNDAAMNAARTVHDPVDITPCPDCGEKLGGRYEYQGRLICWVCLQKAQGGDGSLPEPTLNGGQPDQEPRSFEFATYTEFAARNFPDAEPLLGKPGEIFLARGSLMMVYGSDGAGKSTWMVDGIVHLAAGEDWLGIPVPRPVKILIVENEGPPSLFQQKLADRIANWEGPDPKLNLYVYAAPWGEFSFADDDARTALRDFCDQHQIEVVAANPTLGLGATPTGRPDETQMFVDWLTECGLKTTRAFFLAHHENKAGQISGDWGRHPDTKVSLARDGNHQRTRLDWNKTRWATLDPSEKMVLLDWVTETKSYTVIEMNTVGASDDELDDGINAYLAAHPASSTRTIQANVKGNSARIRARLDAKFDSTKGPRNSILWFPRSTATEPAGDAQTHWDENADEHWD